MAREKNSSSNIQLAKSLIQSVKNTQYSKEELVNLSIKLAGIILDESNRVQTKSEKKLQNQMSRLMDSRMGKVFTTCFTDQSFRSTNPYRVADQMIHLMDKYGIPSYFPPIKQLQLKLFRKFGRHLAPVLVPITKKALEMETKNTIVPAEPAKISKHIQRRRREGVKININRLGEAMLGEGEAKRRFDLYRRDLENCDIDYISVKISTIYSQINTLAQEKTLSVLAERLRGLYRTAMENGTADAEGNTQYKFVNLDMEEYKDLHLTVDLFKTVLSEKEFLKLPAGIVLQAYLPDSLEILKDLTKWAQERVKNGGAPIKVRIVKGANLLPEQFEASVFGWPQTPYQSKSEVDASYKHMMQFALQPENAHAVHIGIGSHNIFDISYAMLLRAQYSIEECVIFEMLEGMADNMRRVVQEIAGGILLYCPIVTKRDFQNAIAYLIRRLDENTGHENFLCHAWGLTKGSDAWSVQAERFRASVFEEGISHKPRRIQDRNKAPKPPIDDGKYHHEPDTDFTLPQNIKWISKIREKAEKLKISDIPLQIGGKKVNGNDVPGEGIDPSIPDKKRYTYHRADSKQVDAALTTAKDYENEWAKTTFEERQKILKKVAQKIREKRTAAMTALMIDGGKIPQEADPEISEAIDFVEYYSHCLNEMGELSDIKWDPKGTVLVASPWNFPFAIPNGGIIGALAAGNCVIFKPASHAVYVGWTLCNILWDAGIPKKALQFVPCSGESVGSELIKDKRINEVILTGGTTTAKQFLEMRPGLELAAELGGKNALVVTAMADRDVALKDIVQSAFGHSGQKCSACSLLILEAEVYDDKHFEKNLKDAVASLHVGSVWDPGTKVGPMILPPKGKLLEGLKNKEKHERWVLKPVQHPDNPHIWSPGIKYGVTEESTTYKTELFGPVLSVMRAKDLRHAIKLANGTPYGLTSGIHSLDDREQKLWRNSIQAGNLYINRGITGAIVDRQPFGGRKASCYGRGIKAGGRNYVMQFTHPVQIDLPEHRSSLRTEILPQINALSSIKGEISSEEEGILTRSLESYAFWEDATSKQYDSTEVVGQDNFSEFKAATKMVFRIHNEDRPIDIVRVIGAALSCKTALEVSYSTEDCPVNIDAEFINPFKSIRFIDETEKQFNSRVEKRSFERIRILQKGSDELKKAAAKSMTYICHMPVMANGRIELQHYLREEAISVNYHRYGYLAEREGEPRTEIL